MRLCPDEANYSTIAKRAKVTPYAVAKQFEMIKKMLSIQKPLTILCSIVRQSCLWYDDLIK